MFCRKGNFDCPFCGARMQYRGSRSISVRDTPYNELDIILEVECPSMRCHCCDAYRRIRPEAIHPAP